jgi:hypothetical protein
MSPTSFVLTQSFLINFLSWLDNFVLAHPIWHVIVFSLPESTQKGTELCIIITIVINNIVIWGCDYRWGLDK